MINICGRPSEAHTTSIGQENGALSHTIINLYVHVHKKKHFIYIIQAAQGLPWVWTQIQNHPWAQ
jgi:hypothetical protein